MTHEVEDSENGNPIANQGTLNNRKNNPRDALRELKMEHPHHQENHKNTIAKKISHITIF